MCVLWCVLCAGIFYSDMYTISGVYAFSVCVYTTVIREIVCVCFCVCVPRKGWVYMCVYIVICMVLYDGVFNTIVMYMLWLYLYWENNYMIYTRVLDKKYMIICVIYTERHYCSMDKVSHSF